MRNRDERHRGYIFAVIAFLVLALTAGASCGGGELPDQALNDLNPDIIDDPPPLPDESEDADSDADDEGDDEGDDGDSDVPLTAVFVSSALGNNANSGSYLRPVATISRGIQIAAAAGLADIYVMHGTYAETAAPGSGMNLIGCVASVDSSGNITFSQDNSSTILAAPDGSQHALAIQGVSDVTVDCFTVRGGASADESIGALVTDSQNVEISRAAFFTPGSAGATCRDVRIEASSAVALVGDEFTNSGLCMDYTAVSIDSSDDVSVSHESAPANFVFRSGNELYAKGVQSEDSSSVEIAGAVLMSDSLISDEAGPLADHTVFSAVMLADTSGARVEGNSISVQGGLDSTGISLRCNDEATHYAAERNSVSLEGALEGVTGVRINCPMPNGEFEILGNRMRLTGRGGAELSVKAVEADAQMRPMQLDVINNIVIMPMAASDMAHRTGVDLKKLNASGSEISVIHNTFIMPANQGLTAAVRSDMGSTQFSALGNVFFIYGPNAGNAIFALKKSCRLNLCARDVVANLTNTKFYASPLHMAYYYDTAETEPLSVINECDDDPLIPHCFTEQAKRSGNQLSASMVPQYFDMDAGELLPAYQALAQDLGPLGTGVLTDIDGTARGALPDIGATEY